MMDLHIHVPRPRLFVWCSWAVVTSSSISAINASLTSISSASSTSRQETKGFFRGSQQQHQHQHPQQLHGHFNNRFLQNLDWLLSDPSLSATPTTEAPTSTPTTVPIITTCPTPLFTCADGGNCTSWQEDCNQCTCTTTGGSESETVICTRLGCLCRRDDADTLPQCPPPPPVCTTNPTCVFTADQTVTGYTYDALNTDTDTVTQDDPESDQVEQVTESIPGPYIDTAPSFQGTQTVVAIRVLAPFCEPFCSEPPSVTQIAQDLFGADNTDLLPSVKSIVEACSYGQLQLEPATIINGVTLDPPGIIEVTLDVNFNGMSVQNARDLVNGALAYNSDNNNRALGQDFQQYAAKWVYYLPPELLWNVNRDNTASHAYTSGDQSIT